MPAPGSAAHLDWPWTLAIASFILAQVLLSVFSLHRLVTLLRCRRARGIAPTNDCASIDWPRVTVQLPFYNERAVAVRAIDTAARLEYPGDRLQIQVLDDSTDDTRSRVSERVRAWQASGVDITLLARSTRDGYKAGALAAGLARATGDLIAVFDADFVPAPDFLSRIVPHFTAPRIGMVQARWSHLNRDRSPLTAGQAVMLDAHFGLEHEARMAAGLFFNFNGTAGVWRRECIVDAGGWMHDTLTEDLDLSYRAQLRGWRFRCVSALDVPAELPADVLAFKAQQRRWAQGSIQTARKILPRLLRARLSPQVKLEAVLHLTANCAYPLLLLSGLLLAAVIAAPPVLSPGLALALDLVAIAVGVLPILLFLSVGQLVRGSRGVRTIGDVCAALWVGAGLVVNNTGAVIAGLCGDAGTWERTAKTGEREGGADRRSYDSPFDRGVGFEIAFAVGFALLAGLAWSKGHVRPVPFLLLLSTGQGFVAALSLLEHRRARRPDSGRDPAGYAAASSGPASQIAEGSSGRARMRSG